MEYKRQHYAIRWHFYWPQVFRVAVAAKAMVVSAKTADAQVGKLLHDGVVYLGKQAGKVIKEGAESGARKAGSVVDDIASKAAGRVVTTGNSSCRFCAA